MESKKENLSFRIDNRIKLAIQEYDEQKKQDLIGFLLEEFIENGSDVIIYTGFDNEDAYMVNIDSEIKSKLIDIAKENKVSLSVIIRSILTKWFLEINKS
jgi:hypothetical protein